MIDSTFPSHLVSSSTTAAIANWEDFPIQLRSIIDDLSDFSVPDRSARHIAADAVVKLVGGLHETLTAEIETSPKHGAGSVAIDFVQSIEGTSRHLMDIKEELANIVKRDRLARYDAIRDLTEALGDLNSGLERRSKATPKPSPPAPPRSSTPPTPDSGK